MKRNIAEYLTEQAQLNPNKVAVSIPATRDKEGKRQYLNRTYLQLENDSNIIAAGLENIGINQGKKVVLMVNPSVEFVIVTFALFKLGAVPIMIDPGIGLKPLKTCLAEAEPEAFIGIPKAHLARKILGWAKNTLKTHIMVGSNTFGLAHYSLDKIKQLGKQQSEFSAKMLAENAMAAILFTSGSTGIPKGVIYQQRQFIGQIELMRSTFPVRPNDVDLPTFPLFMLFDFALGIPAVIPEMDATKPAKANPLNLLEAINDFKCTRMFGSPALLNTFSRYGIKNNIKLSTMRLVLSAGAPVAIEIQQAMKKILPEFAEIHTPYGATECLPISTITDAELLEKFRVSAETGKGICVGKPLSENQVFIIPIIDDVIDILDKNTVLSSHEIGEIVVRGPTTTTAYFNRKQATQLAKIYDESDKSKENPYHRMGDIGYLDAEGYLWYCGRKSHRVILANETLFTEQVEPIFNQHAKVNRTALVSVKKNNEIYPVLCVELKPGVRKTKQLAKDILKFGLQYSHLSKIKHVLYHKQFPVDIRHNAKIGREKLAKWATSRLQI